MSDEANRAGWQDEVESYVRQEQDRLKDRTNDSPPGLIEVLEGEDIYLAMLAARRLGELRAEEAIEPLIRVLGTSDETLLVATCCIVLGTMGDRRAVVLLVELLERAEARADAEVTLRFTGPTGIRDRLFRLMCGRWLREIRASSRENVRVVYILWAMYALEAIRDSQAVEPIRKRLADPDERIQARAQKALASLGAA